MFAAHLSEPDHPLWIDGHAIGNERMVPHETGAGIEAPQGVGVEFGKPDSAMSIKRQLVWRAWQRERLALCWLHMISAEKIESLPHQLTDLLTTDKLIE